MPLLRVCGLLWDGSGRGCALPQGGCLLLGNLGTCVLAWTSSREGEEKKSPCICMAGDKECFWQNKVSLQRREKSLSSALTSVMERL